jgi:hypothetical protein
MITNKTNVNSISKNAVNSHQSSSSKKTLRNSSNCEIQASTRNAKQCCSGVHQSFRLSINRTSKFKQTSLIHEHYFVPKLQKNESEFGNCCVTCGYCYCRDCGRLISYSGFEEPSSRYELGSRRDPGSE